MSRHSLTASWRAVRRRLTYANVMSTLAVVVMVSGGTAYAASAIVARAKLADNALALGGVKAADYRQDVSTAASSKAVTVPPGKWVTVLAWKFTAHRAGPMVFLAQATVTSTGKLPGQAQLRLVLNGKPEQGPITDPTGPAQTQTIAGFISCDGMPAGRYSAQLQVQATAASLIVNTSNEFALRPLVVPPT